MISFNAHSTGYFICHRFISLACILTFLAFANLASVLFLCIAGSQIFLLVLAEQHQLPLGQGSLFISSVTICLKPIEFDN